MKNRQHAMPQQMPDIDDIKYQLKLIADATDYDTFCDCLSQIVKPDSAYCDKIKLLRQQPQQSLSTILNGLTSTNLKSDGAATLNTFSHLQKKQANNTLTTHAEPSESFIFPDTTQDIIIPDTKELTDAERQEYKRVLIQCQDDIAIKNYAEAYNHANQARELIEPESAQLYEYLLLTYIKKEGIEQISNAAIQEDATHLDQILLFVQRCKKYQYAQPKAKCSSKTLDDNFECIAYDFTERLQVEYDKIKANWLLDTEGSPQDRKAVANIISLFERVYSEVYKTGDFLLTLYIELCGGGKFQWIDLDIHNKPRNLVENFDAVDKKTIIEHQLKANFNHNILWTTTAFATKVYDALWGKYMDLRAKIQKKNAQLGSFGNENDARYQVIQCFEAFKTAYCLFQDKRFLDIPLKELSSGVFTWFDLGENGTRINKEGFDAETLYQYFATEKGDKAAKDKMDDLIQVNSALELAQKTTARYEQLYKTGLPNPTHYERDRHAIYECLKDWFKSYMAYPQSFLIESIVNEVTGRKSLLTWFVSTSTGFDTLQWVNPNIQAKQSIESFLSNMFNTSPDKTVEQYNWTSLKHLIAEGFFAEVKQRYQVNPIDYTTIKFCKKDLEIVSNCYLWQPKEEYITFMVQDIWTERLWHWFNIDENGRLVPNYDAQESYFEPYAEMEALYVKMGYALPKYRIIGLAANRFYTSGLDAYKAMYPDDTPVNRKLVIDFIRRCKAAYFMFQNPTYLEIPVSELKGFNKFKWINEVPVVGRINVLNGKIDAFDAIQALGEFTGILDNLA
ncbi:MAG: hypothetical protein U5L45_24500 [Saprospiraceae bacterium]|nr:hypothetical protein [Saprospiraceae bacterium]